MKEKHTYHRVDAPGNLPEALRANPYTVPNGYFENLHLRITQKRQHAEDAPAAFGVPTGYFDQLEDLITARIAEQTLKAVASESGFAIPEGYAGQLEHLLVANRKIHENVAEPGFTVPEHYFDDLQDRITQQTIQRATTPVRKINRSKWAAYAAAASIAVVMGLVGMLRLANDASTTKSPLASVSDQQIFDYLELYGTADDISYISEQLDDFDERSIGEGISDEDIEAYLNHTL